MEVNDEEGTAGISGRSVEIQTKTTQRCEAYCRGNERAGRIRKTVEESQRLMIQNNLIHEGERLDESQRNGYGIIQNPARFCFGMDAVLLSGFCESKGRGKSTGSWNLSTGIIPI